MLALACALPVRAEDAAESPWWSLHAQLTNVTQLQPAFHSPYEGANSLDPDTHAKETVDATLFAGLRLWRGAAVYANPEIDQGFGLSDTLGVAGFPSGEAYKVGQNAPYFRLPRAFFRQVIDLGGEAEEVPPGPNEVGGTHTRDHLTLTAGKLSAVDLFDTNRYAHDPHADFLNWAIIDSGAFDYAADAWGYTYGMAAEWTQSWWTFRGGVFDMSEVPNSKHLDRGFSQVEFLLELEERHTLFGHAGELKLLGFLNRARMASYRDAVALGAATASTPDVALVRQRQERLGIALNVEQEVTAGLGVFLRLSSDDGRKEAFEFTEINRSAAAGLSLSGSLWGRPDDTFGLAAVVNGISGGARDYFAAGGLGILIGDGRLPHYGAESIVETWYSFRVASWLSLGLDYQLIQNPAYNRDRGPVSVIGLRVHLER
ncbi:MAG TPA: carbohydrate porin [Myxococcota bacterium]|nr:carbohydrate porin [Myxococcota bacterium]